MNPNRNPTPLPDNATQAERLSAAFDALVRANPFVSDFKEYSARLKTGKEALVQFSTPAGRERQDAVISAFASATTAGKGGALIGAEAHSLAFQINARAALTAKWYEALILRAAELDCDPALTPYIDSGIPKGEAAHFFALKVPPVHAVNIYGMIYPEAITDPDEARKEQLPDRPPRPHTALLTPAGSPVGVLRPMEQKPAKKRRR